ncbi:DUF397 domain-containing protein [Streptomyces chumphonensis]|uniref:DUF397 domain-containing protein n=1 Tax=Streptomyces chumphonensis TaxID=1214925 RepID=A0A927F1W5_9ACTN|nr:DUF397 domain-containing protein [Streptomyces chumphonensis]MBD3934075.1 DUF397 domain-containing protein [Streptomyces chumphonensis]
MSDLAWSKSSYSSGGDGDCVEVAAAWRKSTYSSSSGDDCVEVAECAEAVHVRDSKRADGPQFVVGAGSWVAFLGFAVRG